MPLIVNEKYAPEKLEKLQEYVRIHAENGEPVEYEIIVDGFRAVRRTSNPDLFPLYESFVKPGTQGVEILFFNGTSRNNDRHIFYFGDPLTGELNGSNGKGLNAQIQAAISRAKEDWQNDKLKEDHANLKTVVEDLEEEIERLENLLAECQGKQSPLNGFLGDVGSSFVESFIKRNPQVLANLPGGTALAGLLEESPKQLSQENDPEVTF
nr:hypothetical protein [Bacteroidota bacterium]